MKSIASATSSRRLGGRAGPAGDPRMESWAQRVEPSQRDNLLAELLQTELELRQEQGDVLRLEEYRARFPELERAG